MTRLGPGPSYRAGVLAVAPILLGVVPFGLIVGVAPIEAGMRWVEAAGFSFFMFAGAAQLAAIELLGDGAPALVAVSTAVIINLRFAMYSASLAPHLAGESRARRVLGAYLLTDQAYALSMVRLREDEVGTAPAADPWWFYFGAASLLWINWQLCTLAGALLGDLLPGAVPLDFAVPLAFLSLLVPNIADRPTLAAALVAGAVATAGAPLPANLGMPLGAITGVAVGWYLSRRARGWS